MQIELIVFILIAVAAFFLLRRKPAQEGRRAPQEEAKSSSKSTTTSGKGYATKNVRFVEEKDGYVHTLQKELQSDLPHFHTLRKLAAEDAQGYDYFATKFGNETWLFPVSQVHLKDLYSMTQLGGKFESIPFSMAVGYAPRGMPFAKTDEHWKALRKNLAPIFHTEFFNAYSDYFKTALKDLVEQWKSESGNTRNVKGDICDMAFKSALMCLTGATLDVDVPYQSANGEQKLHIKDVNTNTLNDFAKHAATPEFIQDKDYRLREGSEATERLNKNMDTLGGALTGLVEARAGELAGGAESKKTIVDAAYGLLTQGIIKDVNEAVQHGWAILNGAHNNCGNALAAALHYLLNNSDCYDKLKEEINQLTNGNGSVDNLDEVVNKENLHDLDYLNMVVKETLRLSSPIYGKPMRANQDVKLSDGFTITKGTVVYPNNGVIGVSENIWSDPFDFKPERFDPESKLFKLPNGSKREPITWLAFGAGPRACMGDQFSMYFMKVGLVYLMSNFEFDLKSTNHEEGFFYWLNDKNYDATIKAL